MSEEVAGDLEKRVTLFSQVRILPFDLGCT